MLLSKSNIATNGLLTNFRVVGWIKKLGVIAVVLKIRTTRESSVGADENIDAPLFADDLIVEILGDQSFIGCRAVGVIDGGWDGDTTEGGMDQNQLSAG
jgi:hypothetical protein